MMDGLALRIEDAGLQGDEDARFHVRTFGWKVMRRAMDAR
jgi:hypothetical protein